MGHGNEQPTLDYPESCYHDPYDTARLVHASRRVLDAMLGETPPDECRAAYEGLKTALHAFPEEPPPERPLPSLVGHGEPIPPGGGRWATEREYREHVERTTLTAAEWRRYAANRRPN